MVALTLRALLLLAPLPTTVVQAQELDWYLPSTVQYDQETPRPSEVLGWEVGSWHVRHDQLVQWYRTIADASPRFTLMEYGRTHEQRPLLLAAVSSPANLARLEEIREAHLRRVVDDEQSEGPTVIWMGYGVHGNESSASNASLLFAYHLAAARGEEIEAFLEKTVVLIDPCVNPDGLSRFAQWANMHRGKNLVGDPAHRERSEAWPGGRTNHYWFDLNRDWLLQTHPESRGRLEQFHRWMPCVLTDFHEMGGDSTYFFQPGIPSRRNPLTPEENVVLTGRIAEYHAKALDGIGSLYYTEESFDDFYYGKGSTYPDLQGCIGILFEQASSRGHLRENSYGGISFPFTVRNQFTTSLSTLDAVNGMRDDLEDYQRRFFRQSLEEAADHPVKGYVFGDPQDGGRTFRLADLLRRHGIQVKHLAADLAANDDEPGFDAKTSLFVPIRQPQFRLIRALFEHRTSWPNNTFYDVSSWAFPESFNLKSRGLTKLDEITLDGDWGETRSPVGTLLPCPSPVAWVFDWSEYEAPRILQKLLAAGVRARVATKPFHCPVKDGEHSFAPGAIVVPTGIQEMDSGDLLSILAEATEAGIDVFGATSGLTPQGVDLGSNNLRAVEPVQPLLLVGSGVSAGEAGEVWHYLDQRLDMPVSLVEGERFRRLQLERYTHILLVAGASAALEDESRERLEEWVRAGGTLIATKDSAVWAARTLLSKSDTEDEQAKKDESAEEPDDSNAVLAYGDYSDLRAEQRIAGTIFRTQLDQTHPLCFGYANATLPVFRNFEQVLPEGSDPFANPVRYLAEPLVSGFASKENVERIAGTPAVRAERMGRGVVIAMVDNPHFRGVWYGTNKLYANALFFGPSIQRTGALSPR